MPQYEASVEGLRDMLQEYKPVIEACYKSSIIYQIECKLLEMGVKYRDEDFSSHHDYDFQYVYERSQMKKEVDAVLATKEEDAQEKILDAIFAQEKICLDANYFFNDPKLPVYKDRARFETIMKNSVDKTYNFINVKTGEFFGKESLLEEKLTTRFVEIINQDFEERCTDFATQFSNKFPFFKKRIYRFARNILHTYGQDRLKQEVNAAKKHVEIWIDLFTRLVKAHIEAKLPRKMLTKLGHLLSVVPDDQTRSIYGAAALEHLQTMRDEHAAIPLYVEKLMELKKEELVILQGIGGRDARRKFEKVMQKLYARCDDIISVLDKDSEGFDSLTAGERKMIGFFKDDQEYDVLYMKQFSFLLLSAANSNPNI